jgi:hypothetical protein
MVDHPIGSYIAAINPLDKPQRLIAPLPISRRTLPINTTAPTEKEEGDRCAQGGDRMIAGQ